MRCTSANTNWHCRGETLRRPQHSVFAVVALIFLIVIYNPIQAQEPDQITHIVEPGDNLYRLSRTYGVSIDAIAAANNLSDVNYIYIGQQLIIPVSGDRMSDPVNQSDTALPIAYVNGLPVERLVVLTNETTERMQAVYNLGQSLGNDSQAVARVGDSITVSRSFLRSIGTGLYDLADYDYLQTTVDYYSASLRHTTRAAGVGWAAFAVMDRTFTQDNDCLTDESPLLCEYRMVRPSIALIMFGTNDMGYRSPTEYRNDLIRIVDLSEAMGVIPVLSTIPPRPGYEATVNTFNNVVREISNTRHIPLWDYHLVMLSLPNLGLSPLDNLHPSTPPGGSDNAANFQADNLIYGYVVRNLTALHVLYTIRQSLGT